MSITKKKSVTAALGAAAAAVAAPAMLFLGAGTAQAGTQVTHSTNALGVTVHIKSDGTSYGWCKYTAIPWAGVGIPVYDAPFYLQSGATHDLWFPGVQLGTLWQRTVVCDVGGTQIDYAQY